MGQVVIKSASPIFNHLFTKILILCLILIKINFLSENNKNGSDFQKNQESEGTESATNSSEINTKTLAEILVIWFKKNFSNFSEF